MVIALFAPPLAEVALKFGPAEYFSLMVLGLVGATVLAHGSLVKAIAMTILGLLLGLVGTDVNSGIARFSFGIPELSDGIGFVIVAMGLFGFAEIIPTLSRGRAREVFVNKVTGLMPTWKDFKRSIRAPSCAAPPSVRCSASCRAAGRCCPRSPPIRWKRKSATRPSSARARSAGVAAPESANNAGAQTSFIPLLTLGIPSNAVMALMIGAMMIQGIARDRR